MLVVHLAMAYTEYCAGLNLHIDGGRMAFVTGVRRQIIRTIASDTIHGFGTVETSIHQRLATGNPVRADCPRARSCCSP